MAWIVLNLLRERKYLADAEVNSERVVLLRKWGQGYRDRVTINGLGRTETNEVFSVAYGSTRCNPVLQRVS